METGGLGTGFTDLSISQRLYLVNLSVNIVPHYLSSSEHHKTDITVTRSYDDSLRCLTCTGPRKLHRVLEKGKDLILFISDQHTPAVIPPPGRLLHHPGAHVRHVPDGPRAAHTVEYN